MIACIGHSVYEWYASGGTKVVSVCCLTSSQPLLVHDAIPAVAASNALTSAQCVDSVAGCGEHDRAQPTQHMTVSAALPSSNPTQPRTTLSAVLVVRNAL